MDFSECTKFATENPVCFVATTDGSAPHVRAFALWYADETGFYFDTAKPKKVCQQLMNNPNVELCFYQPTPDQSPGKMMRVSGRAEFLEDRAVKERLLEEQPFLKDLGIQGPDDPNLAVFRVANGEAFIWTMDENMREKESEHVKF